MSGEAQMTQEEMLAAQKANCIFCKINAGEVPSKKVFEDELMLAILDINPALKGHMLVMPKEHYPILPLVPPETFTHMFRTTKKLMTAVRKSMIVPRVTLFIANGGVAGQRSPHFLYHVIPREPGDGLDQLDLRGGSVDQSELAASLAQNIQAIMRNHLARAVQSGSEVAKKAIGQPKTAAPAPVPRSAALAPHPVAPVPRPAAPESHLATPATRPVAPSTVPAPTDASREAKEQLLGMLEAQPELKQLIMQNPVQVKEYVQKSPELSVLFEGVDIHALSAKLNQLEGKNAPRPASTSPSPVAQSQDQKVKTDDVPDASTMDDEDLLAYLAQKPKLKELLLTDPGKLAEMTESNPRVAAFFANISPVTVAERVREILRGTGAQGDVDGAQGGVEDGDIDFNALAAYLDKDAKKGGGGNE